MAKLNSAADAVVSFAWHIIDSSNVALARPVTVVLVDTKSVANCVTPLATRDVSVCGDKNPDTKRAKRAILSR